MKETWLFLFVLLLITIGCGVEVVSEPQPIVNTPANSESAPDEQTSDIEEAAKDTSTGLNANQVLDDAIAAASADDKRLFVYFSADW